MQIVNLVVVFILSTFTFATFSFKLFTIFQQCSYRIGEFLVATFREKSDEIYRLLTYSLTFCLALHFITPLLRFGYTYFSIAFLLFSIAFGLLCFIKSEVIKRPKLTNRYLRILIASAILYGVFIFELLYLAKDLTSWLCIFLICFSLVPVTIPFFICLGKTVNYPYDKLRYEISKSKCKKQLQKNKQLIKIGITGSFGKTSVKNYLEKMLSVKYKVLSTPKSYNTPLGICKTVKSGVDGYDVFIAEMGARYKNDIKELCKMVCPSVGVITGITYQHTATLGDIEAVKNVKNQLIEGLSSGGIGFFSTKSTYSKQMYEDAKCEKYSVGTDKDCYVYYKNFNQSKQGLHFDMIVGDKSYKVFAPLLGEHNVINICLATAISLKLGVEIEKILSVIPTLEAVEHRAQMITTAKGIMVIDDGYNANLHGIRMLSEAIDGLSGFKVAITSGIVEVGKRSYEINVEVGKILAKHFDLIIAVGVNSSAVEEGANVLGVEVVCVKQTQDSKEIISKRTRSGDVVAFLNDLPDRY